jgi:hypothetical protein
VVVLGGSLAFSAAAAAQIEGEQSADRWVTIAARECDSYTDIRANLARNNIMESLQDLGADTLYQSGEPIDPRTELEGQPTCRPITGWQFTFGSSYRSRAISGGVKIEGAVTIGLTRDQVDRASQNRLWLQGGTPEDPMLYGEPQFTGRYGFGALRCAIDDLNGTTSRRSNQPGRRGHRHVHVHEPAHAVGRGAGRPATHPLPDCNDDRLEEVGPQLNWSPAAFPPAPTRRLSRSRRAFAWLRVALSADLAVFEPGPGDLPRPYRWSPPSSSGTTLNAARRALR